MKIAIANDHAGVEYKNLIIKHLNEKGYETVNFGTDDSASVDYPDYAEKVARAIKSGVADSGILVCGTGIGMSIAANKFKGIRASVCGDCYSAEMTRKHNDANVLCLGARVLGIDLALKIVDSFLNSSFEGGKHARRLCKIENIESMND